MAATFAQLLPSVVVFARWRRTTVARQWIALWCVAFFLSDALQLILSMAFGTNLWVFIYISPVEDALLLWALSHWQTRPVTRMALRIAIPLVIASYVVIAIIAGELESYKTFSGPFRALMIMTWTAFTVVTNIATAPERVWARDWLWTCLGVLLYFGMFVVTEPIIAAMPRDQVENMFRVYNVRAIGDVVAFILIWRGMRCPLPSNSSGST
ncbi:MAG: hypothetical protein IPF98_00035 [Gemmatimonadetes bacterium]|nr:hypothetical protein [Gemmatimonadota bacterium]